MKSEVSKSLMCIVIRGGIELWMEEEKLPSFDAQFQRARQMGGMMNYNGERINPADVVGVFKAGTMEAATRRKNGNWLCHSGTWHDRGEKCGCPPMAQKILNEKITRAIKDCKKCQNGWLTGKDGVRRCECVAKLLPKN